MRIPRRTLLWHSAMRITGVIIALGLLLASGQVMADSFTIPEAKLLDAEFSSPVWGPGSVVRSDGPGDWVQFAFTGLGSGGTGLKDNYPIDTVYGQILPSHGNGDFSNFDGYRLRVRNLDDEAVRVSLFINTGFTGSSGTPSSDPTNDTFWQSAWSELGAGEEAVLFLDFNSATAWNISDNKLPHTQGTDGGMYSINAFDRSEVSAIGFEVLSAWDGFSNPDADIIVSPVVPEPVSTIFFGTGLVGVAGLVTRRRMRKAA